MRVVAMYKVNTGELADVEATRRAREAEQSRQK
jgi:hypothetical protein